MITHRHFSVAIKASAVRWGSSNFGYDETTATVVAAASSRAGGMAVKGTLTSTITPSTSISRSKTAKSSCTSTGTAQSDYA